MLTPWSIDPLFDSFDQIMFPFPQPLFDHRLTDELQNKVNADFNDALANRPTSLLKRAKAFEVSAPSIKLDVIEEKNKYVVSAEVPGFTKEDLKLSVDENNVLTIRGEKRHEVRDQDPERRYLRLEQSYGSASRSLKLPKGVDASKISAKYDNGILKVDIARIEPPQKNVTSVNIE